MEFYIILDFKNFQRYNQILLLVFIFQEQRILNYINSVQYVRSQRDYLFNSLGILYMYIKTKSLSLSLNLISESSSSLTVRTLSNDSFRYHS